MNAIEAKESAKRGKAKVEKKDLNTVYKLIVEACDLGLYIVALDNDNSNLYPSLLKELLVKGYSLTRSSEEGHIPVSDSDLDDTDLICTDHEWKVNW